MLREEVYKEQNDKNIEILTFQHDISIFTTLQREG